MTTVEEYAVSTIRPFHVDISEEALTGLRRRVVAFALALEGAGDRSVAGRAVSHEPGTRPLLGDRL